MLVTMTVYVLTVEPFAPVTTMEIGELTPWLRTIGLEGLPLATVTLLTLMVEVASAAVGVTVMLLPTGATRPA